MSNSIDRLGNTIYYTNNAGNFSQIHLSEELLEVLKMDNVRRKEFKATLKTFRYHEAEWKYESEASESIEEMKWFTKHRDMRLKKLKALNTPYNDTKHIMQLVYGTENYKFLTNDNIKDLLFSYLPASLIASQKNIDSFARLLFDRINELGMDFYSDHMDIGEGSLISHENLFDVKQSDHDVRALLDSMQTREEMARKMQPSLIENEKGLIAEFTIRYLTQTRNFTYDISKALNNPEPRAPLFYMGKDRPTMINKRMID